MSQTTKIITSVVAALILTPLGMVLTFVSPHSYDIYAYIGAVFLFPSFVIARFAGKVSIPLLTSASSAGLLIFVFAQLAWYYSLVALLVFIHRHATRKIEP
jgi:drug/metabolite transporter superfamily protein YnfA